MYIGDILVARGLVTKAEITAALELQGNRGKGLGACLVELGCLAPEDLDSVVTAAPARPNSIEATGISTPDLLNLLMKSLHAGGEATPSKLSDTLKLPHHTVQDLLEEADDRRLLAVLGAVRLETGSEIRYNLTEKGRQWAQAALERSRYVGPAPVSLAAYQQQIQAQRISAERINHACVHSAFSDLVVGESLVLEVGPALNSGRSILLYGPPGNGKSSIAERIGRAFQNVIYVPYCFEVDGEIIKVFDPAVHTEIKREAGRRESSAFLNREDFDQRWVACSRPLIVTGGELSLEMLDLNFNAETRFYEAPLHIKGLGGIFMIDDFGRQLISPAALLNRWIVPMESRVEYLKLPTGKTFSLPFDELVIFCTNLTPSDLMDPAFLRRIPYKIELAGPTPAEFREIFRREAAAARMEATDAVIDYIIARLCEDGERSLACYQPRFIIDQVRTSCEFMGAERKFQTRFIDMALKNLHAEATASTIEREHANTAPTANAA